MALKEGFKDTCPARRLYAQFCIFRTDYSEESPAFVSFSKGDKIRFLRPTINSKTPHFKVTKLGLNYILCSLEDFSEKSACPGLGFSCLLDEANHP